LGRQPCGVVVRRIQSVVTGAADCCQRGFQFAFRPCAVEPHQPVVLFGIDCLQFANYVAQAAPPDAFELTGRKCLVNGRNNIGIWPPTALRSLAGSFQGRRHRGRRRLPT